MRTERDLTLGGEPMIPCANDVLLSYILQTCKVFVDQCYLQKLKNKKRISSVFCLLTTVNLLLSHPVFRQEKSWL